MSEKTQKTNSQIPNEKIKRTIDLILQFPECISLIKNKYITDDILEYCLLEDPTIFKYIPHPSMRIISAALEIDGGNLKHVKKKTRKVLPVEYFIKAINSNPEEALSYVPKKYIPEDLKVEILDTHPELIKENKIKIVQDDFLKDKIKINPQYIKFITDPSEDLKCIALESDPNIALYFDELTPRMMDIIDEKYPTLKEVLPNYNR